MGFAAIGPSDDADAHPGVDALVGEFVVDPEEIDRLIGRKINATIRAEDVERTPSSVISLVDDNFEIIREGKGDVSFFR